MKYELDLPRKYWAQLGDLDEEDPKANDDSDEDDETSVQTKSFAQRKNRHRGDDKKDGDEANPAAEAPEKVE